jgi:plastocyanin
LFKTWQVFVFSLVPLALVFTGVIMGSIHFSGGDSQKEIFPTPPPRPAGNAPPPPSAPPGATVLQLAARTLLFDKRSLSAAANQPVVLQFNNEDAGTLHNFALYTNRNATSKIFGSELTTGPKVETFNFTAPAAGSYYYRCDVHPDTMTGTFTSR